MMTIEATIRMLLETVASMTVREVAEHAGMAYPSVQVTMSKMALRGDVVVVGESRSTSKRKTQNIYGIDIAA